MTWDRLFNFTQRIYAFMYFMHWHLKSDLIYYKSYSNFKHLKGNNPNSSPPTKIPGKKYLSRVNKEKRQSTYSQRACH